jgi:hypothetical protein
MRTALRNCLAVNDTPQPAQYQSAPARCAIYISIINFLFRDVSDSMHH